MKITKIQAIEVLDSRGNPTVSTKLTLENGLSVTSMVPSGASTGSHEALELRDGGSRAAGKGVKTAVENVNNIIAPTLVEKDVTNFFELDKSLLELDGTENKSNLGANAILSVSICLVKAGAIAKGMELYEYISYLYKGVAGGYSFPIPMINVLNGGAHAEGASDFQEYMLLPNMETFSGNLFAAVEVFNSLKKELKKLGFRTLVGDEGGFAPSLESNERPLELLKTAIQNAGYEFGKDFYLALDVAASEFYNQESDQYELQSERRTVSVGELTEYYKNLANKYSIKSIEDPFFEDKFTDFANLRSETNNELMIVGDDLFVTNPKRLKQGIEMNAGNALLVKVNQIGSVSETFDAMKMAQENGFKIIISHRSGETEDAFIADLAVGVNAEYIKTGSLARSDRTAKYNRLLWIEQELHN